MPAPQGSRRAKRPKAGAFGGARRRYCYYCKEKIEDVDYKTNTVLKRFVSEKGKIRSRHATGACRRHQQQVAVAVKRAREMALLPYADR
ncbi:MAG: 30S ribosomal protein S18 [Thermoleophilia bacterium]|jgi:small subunit ribosomal protein S18